ncbi:MAG: transcriptional regulator GfcR [Haloferacaceae archaeon]
MKNVDDLIASAGELAAGGLSRGEIADELNVSRETASWLVERSDATEPAPATSDAGPDDIHVDWSAIGRDGARLGHAARAMADLLSKRGADVDLTVGVEKAGAPLATAVARELDTDLGTYTPAKHRWEEGELDQGGGSFSRNFASIRDRDCYIVDDIVTTGTTMRETVEAVEAEGGSPVACAVVADKRGVDRIAGVPVDSLITVFRVGDGT